MERTEKITIDYRIEQWYRSIKSESGFTDADAEELKTHLLDMMDELQDAGLDEEEAFLIASRRMGNVDEFEAEYRQENQDVLQTRRSAIILSGVLIYFFCFHLVGSVAKIIFISMLNFDISGPHIIEWVNRFFYTIYFLLIILFTSILISEKKVISFLERIRIKPRHTIITLLATFVFFISNISLMAFSKGMVREDRGLRSLLIYSQMYFEYIFPFLFCIGFILIYSKYYKKAKI